MGSDRTATVWAATWVPSRSPIEGFGGDGYAVAWVDVDGRQRQQVLVEGDRPEPGVAGAIEVRTFGATEVEVFVRSDSA